MIVGLVQDAEDNAMEKIDFVHAHYFQTHTDTRVEFGDGASVLIGETEAGKSTLIRALGWVLMDDPSGDFVQFGEKEVSVTVGIDGRVITKTRRGGSTYYVLDDGEPFKGAAVPPSIAKLVNMTHVNWQFQFDSPFWLSDSGGEVSRQINGVVDMQAIDRVMTRATADAKAAVTSTQAAKLNAIAATTAADEAPDVRPALTELNHIIDLEKAMSDASARLPEFDRLAGIATGVFDAVLESKRVASALETITAFGVAWRTRTRSIEDFDEAGGGVRALWGCRKRGHVARDALTAMDKQTRASEACTAASQRLGEFDRDARALLVIFDTKAMADRRVESMSVEVSEAVETAVSSGSLCGECGRPL